MRFQHHPDGWITVNDFVCQLEEFLVDEPGYKLPESYIGREYVPGVKHFLLTDTRADPQPLEWAEGDQYLTKAGDYKIAFKQRQEAARAAEEKAAQERMTYIEKRRAEYPSVQDQLDALWAGGEQAAAMKAQLEAINAKYPVSG